MHIEGMFCHDMYFAAFPPRTREEQLRFAQSYAKLSSQSARDEFVRKFATRWSELARLPYFDVCRMIVIDPMHNLLLGMLNPGHFLLCHNSHIWSCHRPCQNTFLPNMDSAEGPSQD